MKKRLTDGLLGLIIGVILILFLTPKQVDVTDQLKQQEKEYKKQIELLNKNIEDSHTRELLLLNTVKLLRMDKSKVIREKELYRLRYEKLKNTPVPIGNLTDQQIDSVLSILYPR